MASGEIRLRRRISARSIPSRPAARSRSRSITNVPCGRPAPRTGVTGTLLVAASLMSNEKAGTAYGPSRLVAEL